MVEPTALENVSATEAFPGVYLTQLDHGDQLHGQHVRIEPESRVESHQHPSEQFTYVLSGECTCWIDERSHQLKAGDSILIPGDMPHAVATDEQGVTLVDVFSPPRPELFE